MAFPNALNGRWAFLAAIAVLFMVPLSIQLFLPLCWQTLTLRKPEEALRGALIRTSEHPKVQLNFEDPEKMERFLSTNPDCCRILDRPDPFYAEGFLDKIWGAQTVIYEIITPSLIPEALLHNSNV
jgi:hypothetical protein